MTLNAAPVRLRSALGALAKATAVVAGLLMAGGMPVAQAATFEEQIAKAAVELGASTRLKDLTPEQQREATMFVIGNMLFSVFHEFGHAVMSEMELPVLGRQEDAADSFAIVAGINMMTDVSERALIEAGKGWFFTELSDRKRGAMAAFYNSHGMNLQRAYQIVCYMVGANPEKFKNLAAMTNLPESRQATCKDDYAIAAWSWEEVLKPYLASTGKPSARIDVGYDEGKDQLEVYAKTFKELGFLDRIAKMATDKFVWRRPLTMRMESCGKVNAWWNERNAKITVCYELVEEFVQLYVQFMNNPVVQERMQALKPAE